MNSYESASYNTNDFPWDPAGPSVKLQPCKDRLHVVFIISVWVKVGRRENERLYLLRWLTESITSQAFISLLSLSSHVCSVLSMSGQFCWTTFTFISWFKKTPAFILNHRLSSTPRASLWSTSARSSQYWFLNETRRWIMTTKPEEKLSRRNLSDYQEEFHF